MSRNVVSTRPRGICFNFLCTITALKGVLVRFCVVLVKHFVYVCHMTRSWVVRLAYMTAYAAA